MTPRNVIRFGGALLCLVGLVLLVATGAVASALGASGAGAVAGATDPASMAFWYQLTFMRLFGTAMIGLGAVLLWCASHLTSGQQGSLVNVLAIVLGALALMTAGQQLAIWNATAGWVLAGTFGVAALMFAASARRDVIRTAV